jgi:thiamine biosynthesis lipoprotein
VVHHLLDPRTGLVAATDLAAVTVVAPTGWQAEVHATAAILAGSAGALDHLHRHHLSGLVTLTDGEILATADLAATLTGPVPASLEVAR